MADSAMGAPGWPRYATLHLPISGNPIGFNHFAAAEWLLRAQPALTGVCFVLSNGRHPDPTKPDAEVPADVRRRLCEAAIAAVADPARSFLARQAALREEPLLLTPQRIALSTAEFGFDRAVRTAELIPLLRTGADPEPGADSGHERLPWCAGSDLLQRMADPRIFSDEDLQVLAASCHYHVLERDDVPAAEAVAEVQRARGVTLRHTAYPRAEGPAWLGTFLELSSTRIRHAAEAGDPLAGLLPTPAAEDIVAQGLYREGRPAQRVTTLDGTPLTTRSVYRLAVDALQAELDAAAGTLAEALTARSAAALPHSLGVVETTTGGVITAALAGRAGASRYFRQGRFAYDGHAKTALVGGDLPGSAVSREAVVAMAEAMRREARVDYALAESGMAGPPDVSRRSLKYGRCWMAVAGPRGTIAAEATHNPFLTRREHQLRFAVKALALVRQAVGD